jgi:hypothetical protein
MYRQRMDAALQFVRQRRIDHAMAFEPALPAEGFRYDIQPVMGLAARPVSGVALVQMGFILDMHTFRRERREELCRDDILHSHFAILGANRSPLPRRGAVARAKH